jgi:hypothetical protein
MEEVKDYEKVILFFVGGMHPECTNHAIAPSPRQMWIDGLAADEF